jgi:Flp pilus assembly protein TadG
MAIPIRTVPKNRRNQRGSAMIELAITLMGFLLMSLGVMEFGLAVYANNKVISSAQDAARWASVRGSQNATPATAASIQDYVQSIAIGLSSNQLNVNTTWSPNNKPGSAVQVTVAYTFVPLSYLAITRSLNLSSTAQVVINH